MASLAECMAKAGDALSAADRRALAVLAQEFRRQGMKPLEADRAAVQAFAQRTADEIEQTGRTLQEGRELDEQATAGDKVEAEVMDARMAQLARDYPDMQIMTDDMEAPLPLSEFMARVKAEADAEIQTAPLYEVAAQCALINGPQ